MARKRSKQKRRKFSTSEKAVFIIGLLTALSMIILLIAPLLAR
jgi:cell division protein FtsL